MALPDTIVIVRGTDTPDDPSLLLEVDYNNHAVMLVYGEHQFDLHKQDLPAVIAALQEAQKRLG